ncbi:uncharacterized protein METZ01_LOCUS500657, partial [marine metagenome]
RRQRLQLRGRRGRQVSQGRPPGKRHHAIGRNTGHYAHAGQYSRPLGPALPGGL